MRLFGFIRCSVGNASPRQTLKADSDDEDDSQVVRIIRPNFGVFGSTRIVKRLMLHWRDTFQYIMNTILTDVHDKAAN
jgi:hypothetical protein